MKIDNFNEQRRIIRQSNTSIQYLEDYAENMRAIYMELQSAWEKNPDRNYTLQAFVSCVNNAADIVHDYSTFSVNAISFVGQIEKLDKIVKGKWLSGHNSVKKLDRVLSGTYKNQIRVNSQTLASYAAKVNGLGAKLDSTRVKTDSINSQVDKLIMQQFLNSKNSLSEINKRIKKLQKLNSQLSNALNQIAGIYQTEEQKLKVAADVVVNKGESSGQIDVTIQKAFTEERDKIQYTMPEAKEYNILNVSSEFFEPQVVGGDCNVTSNSMLLKRLLYMNDDSSYSNVNRNTVRETVTGSASPYSKDVLDGYTYKTSSANYHVSCFSKHDAFIEKYEGNPSYHYGTGFVDLDSTQKKDRLKLLLDEHPEGIVIWGKYATKFGGAHAVLLTSYDENGNFYCADPADKDISGEIPLTQSVDARNGESDTDILNRITQYYVAY